MSDGMVVAIANAINRIASVKDIDEKFRTVVSERPIPDDIPSEVQIDGICLRVPCFDWEAYAKPRVVSTRAANFAIEYIFL